MEPGNVFEVGEFTARDRCARYTLRNIDFPKGFLRFAGNHQRARPDLCTAGDNNGGDVVFPRVFNGSQLFLTLSGLFYVILGDKSYAGIVDFPQVF